MLTITETAAEAIRTLAADAGLPEGGGLRIATAEEGDEGLELVLARTPDEDDIVLKGAGVAVFLEAAVAQMLEAMVLDVHPGSEGDGGDELRFALGPQDQPG